MTIASHHHHGSDTDHGRSWIVVVAATGWVAVTTVAVLLATDVWSVDRMIGEQSRPGKPGQVQQPGDTGPPPSSVPTPRADHEGLVYVGSPLARVPRQAAPRER